MPSFDSFLINNTTNSDNFDDDYEEMNAGIAFGPIAIDTSHGEYKKGAVGNTKDHNYSFTSIAYDMSGLGLPLTLTYGEWGGSKLKGDVTTLSYGTSVAGADVGLEVESVEDQEGDEMSLEAKLPYGITVEGGKRSHDGTTEDAQFVELTWSCCKEEEQKFGINDKRLSFMLSSRQFWEKIQSEQFF